MNQQFRNRTLPTGNPLANALVVIVGIVVISLSLALGFVVFVALACFMLVMAAVVAIRVWWLKKRMRYKSGGDEAARPSAPVGSQRVIEGEFREVRTQEDDQRTD